MDLHDGEKSRCKALAAQWKWALCSCLNLAFVISKALCDVISLVSSLDAHVLQVRFRVLVQVLQLRSREEVQTRHL